MSTIDPKIIEKMQKLLNLKEGAESVGSLAEAENAGAKLQALLLKYNLDESQLQKHGAAKKNLDHMKEVYVSVADLQDKRESNWVQKLYQQVGMNNLCKVYIYDDRVTVCILGDANNISMVQFITEQLVSKIKIAEKLAWKEYKGDEKRGTYRRGFLEGAAYGVGRRLAEELKKAKFEAFDNPYAVMIVNKEAELTEFLIQKGYMLSPAQKEEIRLANEKMEADIKAGLIKRPKKQKIRYSRGPRGNSSSDGYWNGREAGESMSINKGID